MANENTGGLDEKMKENLRSGIRNLILRIHQLGGLYFNESWIQEWVSIVSSENDWFKALWTNKEWKILKEISKIIKQKSVFRDTKNSIPSNRLILLRKEYDELFMN